MAVMLHAEFRDEDDRSRQDDVVLRAATLEAETDHLTTNMIAGVVSRTVARMLSEREAGVCTSRARLTGGGADLTKVLPHPALRLRFEARVADRRRSLADPDNRAAAAKVLA